MKWIGSYGLDGVPYGVLEMMSCLGISHDLPSEKLDSRFS